MTGLTIKCTVRVATHERSSLPGRVMRVSHDATTSLLFSKLGTEQIKSKSSNINRNRSLTRLKSTLTISPAQRVEHPTLARSAATCQARVRLRGCLPGEKYAVVAGSKTCRCADERLAHSRRDRAGARLLTQENRQGVILVVDIQPPEAVCYPPRLVIPDRSGGECRLFHGLKDGLFRPRRFISRLGSDRSWACRSEVLASGDACLAT